MTVYVVMKSSTQSFENDACWDDGYYDDYYETTVTSDEFVGIYTTEELAIKAVELENNNCSYNDNAYYFPYKVEETINEEDYICQGN